MLIGHVLFILVASIVGTGEGGQSGNLCAAEIRVFGDSKYAQGVHPVLVSNGPKELYLPRYQKVGFRVTRAEPGEPEAQKTEVIEVKASKINKPSLVYDFRAPSELRVWWEDVGFEGSGPASGFTVLPGRYRFSVLFSGADPTEVEKGAVELCRAYSDIVTVRESSHFLVQP